MGEEIDIVDFLRTGGSWKITDYELMDKAAAEILDLRAEVERLTRENASLEYQLEDAQGHLARWTEAIETRAEAMERAAQIADDKAAGHLAIWGDESTLPETAIEHMVCAEALQEAAAAIRQAGKDGGAG